MMVPLDLNAEDSCHIGGHIGATLATHAATSRNCHESMHHEEATVSCSGRPAP